MHFNNRLTGRHLPAAAAVSLLTATAPLPGQIGIATVEVANPGNASDTVMMGDGERDFGGVAYVYEIGLTEVTNAQYAAFLNAIAASDPNALFHPSMTASIFGGIARKGTDGSYTYEVRPGWETRPVTFVSFYDAARFCNWLHNGQPAGPQGAATTETGVYTMLGPTSIGPGDIDGHGRNTGWLWAVTNSDEWHKAAYNGPGNTWTVYATQSNTAPTPTAPPGPVNSANYDSDVGELTGGGAYATSPSFWGSYDQNGNVSELTEGNDSGRWVRGGRWDSAQNALQSSMRGLAGFDDTAHSGIGFRIVRASGPDGFGACCLGPGQCHDGVTDAECGSMGGTFSGVGSVCLTEPCGPPTGACCFTDGTCQDAMTDAGCSSAGGIFQGGFSNCGSITCPVLGDTSFVGIAFSGDVYRVTGPGGNGAFVGSSSFFQCQSMARDSTGLLLSSSSANDRLIEVDPATGAATVFHLPFLGDIRALAFSPDDELYAVEGANELYLLDLSVPQGDSSIKIFIGDLTHDLQGLTFAPDGTLYGWSVNHGLVVVDPLTAASVDVNQFTDGTAQIQTITVAPDGNLYGARDSLYLVDPVTGAYAELGSGGYDDIRGFEWAPPVKACLGDIDGNGTVGTSDLLLLLSAWGGCVDCPEDLTGDGIVGTADLLLLLSLWGPCV